MKTIFDKIYVINLVENIERKKFIEQEFKYYKLDFEFIHTIDLYNLFDENTFNFKDPWDNKINIRAVSCALGNYMAVKQAYEFECNNVLIIEDDVCFTKDKKLLNGRNFIMKKSLSLTGIVLIIIVSVLILPIGHNTAQ